MLRRLTAVAVVASGALLGAGPAAAVAHPLLEQAAPAAGLVTPKAPDAIRLALSEPVAARGSSIVVTGPRGARVPVGALQAADGGRALSVTPSAPLRSAVYRVRWSVLGDDGHRVGGTFDFGVAGAGGAPPPEAEKLGGTPAGGRGGEQLEGVSVVGVLGGWLGILAASALLGGAALVAALRRRSRGDWPTAAARLRPLALLAWLLVALAASEGVLAAATAGTDGSLDPGLLTASSTGAAALVRGLLVVVFSLVLLRVRRGPVFALGGALVLVTYALSGHALVGLSPLELVAQGAHVLAAGLWLGGLLATIAIAGTAVPVRDAIRAYAPVTAAALVVTLITGVVAALREVDTAYFLRWSDYGRVVVVKSALVVLVLGVGALANRRPQVRLLRLEAGGVLVVVALAAILGGLSQGRGRPLPAQEGTLVPGAAFATVLLPKGSAPLALAPARRGRNVLTLASAADRAAVRLQCACASEPVTATLTRTDDGPLRAEVDLPADGGWYAYVSVDGRTPGAPVALQVGVPSAPGAPSERLLVAADLTGPGAARCRAQTIGLQLAAGRVNAEGGVRGGRKLAPYVVPLDRVRQGLEGGRRPIAAAVCGDGGERAAAQLARAGIPVVVPDPDIAPVRDRDVFRTAADPYAQGTGIARYLQQRVLPTTAVGVRTVLVAATDDDQGRRLTRGVADGIAGTGLTVKRQPPGRLGRGGVRGTKRALDRGRIAALVLDQPVDAETRDVDALAAVGRTDRDFPPAPVLASSRVLSERLITRLGTLGRIGVLQGVTEVSTQTADALAYARAVPGLWPGERPSLDGLRGYVAGLALRSALEQDPDHVADRLRAPRVFTDALLSPWEPRRPGAGTRAVIALAPQFLASSITPPSAGGTSYTGTWFADGAWINAGVRPYALTGPAPAL